MSQLIRPKAYLFDYGGTLDTGGHHWGRVIWRAWQQVGVPVTEDRFREAYIYAERTLGSQSLINPTDTFRRVLDVKLRLQLQHTGCETFHAQLLDLLYASVLRHTAHSRSVLHGLAAHCRLAVVSNFYGNLTTVLHEFGLDNLFATVVDSAVVGVRKPDARIFAMAIHQMGLNAADVAVVGDSLTNDLQPARQLGCQTVWLRGQQWADVPAGPPPADWVIHDLQELL